MRFPIPTTLVCALAVVAISLAGCDRSKESGLPEDPPPNAHAHPSEGPHHGHLIELGNEEYHGELLHDEESKTVTVYILDSSAKKEVKVAQDAVSLNVVLDSAPQSFPMQAVSPADGKASQFTLVNEEVMEALEHGEETKGRLNVTIEGKSYVGKIVHESHEGHEH